MTAICSVANDYAYDLLAQSLLVVCPKTKLQGYLDALMQMRVDVDKGPNWKLQQSEWGEIITAKHDGDILFTARILFTFVYTNEVRDQRDMIVLLKDI